MIELASRLFCCQSLVLDLVSYLLILNCRHSINTQQSECFRVIKNLSRMTNLKNMFMDSLKKIDKIEIVFEVFGSLEEWLIHMDPSSFQRGIKYKTFIWINDPWRCFHPVLLAKKDLIKISLLQTFHMCDIFCSKHEILFNMVLCGPPFSKYLSPLKYWIRAVFVWS